MVFFVNGHRWVPTFVLTDAFVASSGSFLSHPFSLRLYPCRQLLCLWPPDRPLPFHQITVSFFLPFSSDRTSRPLSKDLRSVPSTSRNFPFCAHLPPSPRDYSSFSNDQPRRSCVSPGMPLPSVHRLPCRSYAFLSPWAARTVTHEHDQSFFAMHVPFVARMLLLLPRDAHSSLAWSGADHRCVFTTENPYPALLSNARAGPYFFPFTSGCGPLFAWSPHPTLFSCLTAVRLFFL